jgi:hypothetical protein
VPVGDRQDLERLMKPGVRLRVPEGVQMVLMARGAMVMQATPGTDVTLPKPPGRWFGRSSQGEVRAGEVRLTTGPRFRGARLALTTPEAQVHVTGTTLAVICDPEGTCVCVLEGHVMVGRREGPMAGVDGGRRRFVYNDDREPEAAEMRPVEAEQLALLRQQSAPMLEPSGR